MNLLTKKDINLLPPPVARERMLRIYLGRFAHTLHLMIGATVLVGLVLLAVQAVSLFIEQIVAERQAVATVDYQNIENELAETNEVLGAVRQWRAEHEPWTPLLPDVMRTIPTGVSLQGLSLVEKSKALVIRGTFSSREAVLLYQRQLEELPWVKDIQAPLSNFQTGQEASFTFELNRELSDL